MAAIRSLAGAPDYYGILCGEAGQGEPGSGGRSLLKSFPLERFYRDSRCGSVMIPWTAETCLDRIGRESLYEAGETDD